MTDDRQELTPSPSLQLSPGVYWIEFAVADRVAYQMAKHPNWVNRLVQEIFRRYGRRFEYKGGGITNLSPTKRVYTIKFRVHPIPLVEGQLETQQLGGAITLAALVALIAGLIYLTSLSVERIFKEINKGDGEGPVGDVTTGFKDLAKSVQVLTIVGAVGLGVYLLERYGVIDA